MTFLIGDPELIKNGRISELPQSAVDFFRSEVRFFRGVDEMRDDARLRHHLCAEHLFDLVRNLVSKGRAAGEEIGDHLA